MDHEHAVKLPHAWETRHVIPRGEVATWRRFYPDTLRAMSRIGGPGSLGGGMQNLSGMESGIYGSGVIPPPLSPVSWWDAEYGAFQDLTKLVPAIANNDAVAVLNDQVTTNHILNTGLTDRPLLKTSAVNGHSAVQFDGTNDILGASFTLADPMTLFLLIRTDTWVSGDEFVAHGNVAIYYAVSTPTIKSFPGTGTGNANNDLSVGAWGILCYRYSGADSSLRTLRVNAGTGILAGSGSSNMAGVGLGGETGAFAAFSIARAAVYNTALSNTDETTVRDAFNTRYAIF